MPNFWHNHEVKTIASVRAAVELLQERLVAYFL